MMFIKVNFPSNVKEVFSSLKSSSMEILQEHVDIIKIEDTLSSKAADDIASFLDTLKEDICKSEEISLTIK
jgi:hypothetical protein